MKNHAKVPVLILLIFSMLACSLFSNQFSRSNEIVLTDEKPVVVLDTGDPDHPRIALFKGGEVLVPDVDVNQNGEVVGIHGATFIAPDGQSMYFYIENGLPVRAIVDDHLIQFEDFTGNTVDITFIAPDGTITKNDNVPFDSTLMPTGRFQPDIHLARLAKAPMKSDIDWLSLASNALTAFSCVAAATAVAIPTAGTATVLLGASCGLLIYATYLVAVNKEPPVVIQDTGTVISGASCIRGVASKDPFAATDCAATILDTVQLTIKKSQETEQKLVTMVGADPTTQQELFTESQVEPDPQDATGINYEDFASVVDNLWSPSGGVASECEDYGNGKAFCKVEIDGGDWKTPVGSECHESGYWYFYLHASEEEASAEVCDNSFCSEDRFSGVPSGEFNQDITTGHMPRSSEPHMIVNAYYQNGPIVATGGLFSCGADAVFPDSWDLQASDAVAFITPVRNWLSELSNR